MKILMTGATGQLGLALQKALQLHEIIPLSHDQLDIADFEAVRKTVDQARPHIVLNAAAYTNVDGAEADAQMAYRVNALGPRNLAVAAAGLDIPLLHLSTDYVFDGAVARAYHEFDRPNPLSVYGASKLAGEEAIRALHRRHYIVRTAWLYHTIGRNFPRTICALATRPLVRVVNDQHGCPTYAPHLASALARLIESDAYGTYHMAGGGQATWYELTCQLFGALGIRTPVEPISSSEFPQLARRPSYTVLTTLQCPAIFLPPWQQGVSEYAAHVKEHQL